MPGIEHAHGGSLLYRIAPEHTAAIVALLLMPLALWVCVRVLRAAAGGGAPLAGRLVRGYEGASLATRTVVVLMLVTAAVHLGLAFGHGTEAPDSARLFVANGLAFIIVAVLAVSVRWWRPLAAVLLLATILAYLAHLLGSREAPDQVGIATKLVELAALGLVLIPQRTALPWRRRRLRWTVASTAVVSLMVATGAITWIDAFRVAEAAASTKAGGQTATAGGHGHGGGAPPGTILGHAASGPPTPQQQAAAARLLAETAAGIEKYQDQTAAIADGYRASTPNGTTVHMTNDSFKKDGRTLDPIRPEGLVYANTRHGPMLLGAVYEMPKPGKAGPAVGGSITPWHAHENICISLTPLTLSGIASPFGRCPTGSVLIAVTPEMIHVWTAPNPAGAFGDLDEGWVRRLVRE